VLGESRVDESLVASWRIAARELGIRVEAPATVDVGREKPIRCVALVRDFGSPHGIAILSLAADYDLSCVSPARKQAEYPGVSLLSDSYAEFDRDHFIDALNDWGWYGDELPPDWYSGLCVKRNGRGWLGARGWPLVTGAGFAPSVVFGFGSD
jgi:hypothetical protein